jgi:hypothetical protein
MGPALSGQRRKRRMSKTPRRPKAKKIKRNPLARALASPKFRARVVPKPGTYSRKRQRLPEVDSEE